MAKNLNYFEQVMTFDELEKEIIRNGKQDDVGSLSGRIGLSNAATKYKPFLYLHFENNAAKTNHLQFKLINPTTAEDLFVSEIKLDYLWAGVSDQNAYNPLFNSLLEYIQANSKTYNK
jgi:hypothetical protein